MGKSIPGGITSPFHRRKLWEGGSPLPGWLLVPVVTITELFWHGGRGIRGVLPAALSLHIQLLRTTVLLF